ncbi:centromere/kinetochore protein zw10-like [Cydia splendana]|uniref:centromere/kinetochore protein zw10-like n=1 Tax=Cydia splendana TaxID=1100963 RepID=UPI002128C7F5
MSKHIRISKIKTLNRSLSDNTKELLCFEINLNKMSLVSAVLQEVDSTKMKDFKKYSDELTPRLKDLIERVEILSWTLQQHFIDSYLNYTTTKSLEQLNYKNRKGNIVNDYATITEELKSLREKFNITDEEFNERCEKLDKSMDVLNEFCVAAEGKRVLQVANHEFRRHNYCEAMLSIKKLQDQIQLLNFKGDAAKALLNLIAQAENQLSLYTAQLSVEWEDLFSWSELPSLHFLTYSLSVQQSDPIMLQKVLRTLYVTKRLNAELGQFSHFFIDQLLHNVIRHNCEIFTEDHIGAIFFNIKIDLANKTKPNYQTIFINLTAIFEFLQSTLGSQLEGDQNFIEIFGNSIRQKFFNKIIDDCIRNNLPSCNSTYENYTTLVVELDAFNKFLIESRFVEASKSPLNKYIDDTECVLYNKKCDKLLNDVRSLLSQSLSYGTEVVGTEIVNENESILEVTEKTENTWDLNKPVFLPKCVISQNVKRILRMILEHLEESIKLPEKYSTQLVSYIKDITGMYQSIVPKKFKINLECCPLDIALFFNNCFYLAHGLLGPPWRSSLPGPLADHLTTTMLVCIQDLRVLGMEKISLYLQKQKNVITQSIEPSELSTWSKTSYEQFDTAVNNAIILMKDLKCSWHHILPTRMYELAMCTLVQAFCQSVLQRIFADSRPVQEDLVYMLAVRLQDSVEDITTLFEEPIELDKKINVWTKFTKMPQLLKAQLLETADGWKNNKELAQSYSCEEVRQIVKMRFPDNKYRLNMLKEIQ